ncbi:CaiB/BaiF CoA-transferase family protein [Pseudonocardia broussonetiae]|uniref:CoA transferase n=1 Tax=Pseudonocardia broussonetiae TaxID=2736640 RepID=A0A6M6JLU7_9PSEU|nr:CoA transferase [Pseudonocardia broussonetiae]QJY48040.1 CoA transferase [Pseudonocardia broussonetiae]
MSALAGLRVLDLSTGIAGPLVGMVFGDFGADVVKIDAPVPDPAWGRPGYAVWNRNKRSVLVDPGRPADLEWLAAAARGADVCILGHGSRLADWGPSVEAAALANAGLVVVHLPAYLPGSTPWSGGESNGLLAAAGGQSARQASVTGGPVESISPHLLYIHGIWAAACAVSALVERTVSGRGQVVTVSGVQAVLEATVNALSADPSLPDTPTTVGPAGRHPTYRLFECADGAWISVGALGPKFEGNLLRALGLDAVLTDPRIDGVTARMSLPDNLPWCNALIEAAFAARPRAELVELITGLGIPCGPVSSRDEWFDSEQVRAIGMHLEIEDPLRGRVEMPGVPIVLTASPGSVTRPAPRPGEHDGIEPWPARPTADPERPPRYVPGPLAGFRVVNMGTFVASPYAGLLLSELGADVIKVEPCTGDPFRVSGYTFNRGMRSVAVDLSSPDGRSVLHRIAATCDVVMDAMRPGVAAKLGFDYDSLVLHRPDIITLSLSAYGEGGPVSARPGVDMVIQAESGMMSCWGGDDTPIANTIAINDVATAALSVLACVTALHHRQVTGVGQRTWDSLAATSVLLQMEDVVRYPGREPAPVGRQDLRGLHPLRCHYEALDGWIYVDVPRDDHRAVDRMRDVGLLGVADGPDALRDAVAGSSVDAALALLARAGVPATRVRPVSEVLRDPRLLEAEAFHIRRSDDGRPFMMTGRYADFSRTQRRGPMVPPGTGEHSRAVLAEAGLDETEIDAVLADGVVLQGTTIRHELPISYR